MSEIQAALESAPNNVNTVDSDIDKLSSAPAEGYDTEDLEDGEIDDDDDDDNDANTIIQAADTDDNVTIVKSLSDEKLTPQQKYTNNSQGIVTIDLAHESTPPPLISPTVTKSKKPQLVEDDHASSIENAIASALKKKGIDPVMPKLSGDLRNGQQDGKEHIEPGMGQSRSSRRRKRKKQRDEKEKERKDKKKARYESPEVASEAQAPPLEDDDDMDDDEMINVRGGSPSPLLHPPVGTAKDQYYDSGDDSCSSYDSYDSQGDVGGASNLDNTNRRRKRGKKDRKRRDRGRNRDDDRNGRQEKRNQRDSADDKHRQEPRKLELCKFYLMECCAKKDKCSYMHADFPCKYYYLGMDCVYNEECKFSHGEPLSEQLRNILLKHLETAPKEILGNFKRISRENAIVLITKRHEELCKQFKVENAWSSIINLPLSHNRNRGDQMMQHHHQQQQNQQPHQAHGNIPSLLELKINPPPIASVVGAGTINVAQSKAEKQRKSRWTTKAMDSSSNSAPNYLDLKNLTGILSAEHIEKLSQLGITNLEQVNQLTFGQLNQIGLTIAEISEIQLNAINMARLGVKTTAVNNETTAAVPSEATKLSPDSNPTNRDVDMRFLPSTAPATLTALDIPKTTADVPSSSQTSEKDLLVSSNSNSNSSNGVVLVDYSQYLKDSNLSFDRGDAYDDEKDDEQLVIDDGNTDNEENNTIAKITDELLDKHESDELNHELTPKLRFTDLSSTLQNPFNSLQSNDKNREADKKGRSLSTFSSGSDLKPRNPFKTYKDDDDSADDDRNYGDDSYYTSRRAECSRSRSRTPSQSSTPEASQSPEPQESLSSHPTYERFTMYDFNSRQAEEDQLRAAKSTKADKDMRFLQSDSGSNVGVTDIDLRLPFQPVTNYTPATEIDGSINTHQLMTYKVYEVEVSSPSYSELRQNFKSDHTPDPRLRRILGLPELSQTKTSAALSRTAGKLSNSIASPESEGASPKYYTPPTMEDRLSSKLSAPANTTSTPRLDPRRVASQTSSASSNTATTTASTSSTVALKQNVEIRNLLQKSEWYKNLNSKFKIMVNQQLAIVSTELKKFHQDSSPNKIFDISFIVNNSTLQQILTNLGIYIDDNGEVARVDADNDEDPNVSNITLPNLSLPPPHQQPLDFLRAPPPNMGPPHIFTGSLNAPPPMNVLPFGSPNTRPSLLGLPPGATGNIFNMNLNPNFGGTPGSGGPGLMGPLGFPNFGPAGMPSNMQQRNFNAASQRNHHHQRNQQNRRNNFNSSSGGNL